jgi:NAD+ synthase
MSTNVRPSIDCLELDLEAEVNRITLRLREILATAVPRRGFVVAMSGGIDSSVSAALCVRAVGPARVFGLLLPERDSADDSTERGRLLADHLGIKWEKCDIAPALDAVGCYKWRDDAIRRVFPAYDGTWKSKIVISGGLEGRINHFRLVVQLPSGEIREERLGLHEYLQLVAATNFKQRIRKTVEYCHADRLNFAVVGTPNRLEYDQGFFVKNGDGSADVKPIAHLYKSQVYAVARHLGLPQRICDASPTTDTYSLAQGQDEFYFALPYEQMDLALWGMEHGCTAAEIGEAIGLTRSQAERLWADMIAKRKVARHLHASPVLVEDIDPADQ